MTKPLWAQEKCWRLIEQISVFAPFSQWRFREADFGGEPNVASHLVTRMLTHLVTQN